MESEVRTFCRKCENSLRSPCDSDEIRNVLNNLVFLAHGCFSEEVHDLREQFTDLERALLVFKNSFYRRLGNVLIKLLTVDWVTSYLSTKTNQEKFDQYFLEHTCDGVLNLLIENIVISRQGILQTRCVSLLERFILGSSLPIIMWKHCQTNSQNDDSQDFEDDELVIALISLPDKMANTLKRENSDCFLPTNYIPRLASCVFHCLCKAHECVHAGNDVRLEFIAKLCGRLSATGHSDLLWKEILRDTLPRVQEDYVWCRLCQRLVTGMPDRSLNAVVTSLIHGIPWYGYVEKYLGDSVCKSTRIEYILCTRLLLMQYTNRDEVIHNIIGYLASSHIRRSIFIKTFKGVLQVWGDVEAIKHSPTEQQIFISKVLVSVCAHLDDKVVELYYAENFPEVLPLAMAGIQSHIASSDACIRKLGMCVGEILTAKFDKKGPQLCFELDTEDEEVQRIKHMLIIPTKPNFEETIISISESLQPNNQHKKQENKQIPIPQTTEIVDSDDDLEPYDLSNDTKFSTVKKPKYIRQCMEGLISKDEPERLEICLGSVEEIIRKHPQGIEEISEELMRILLHLSNQYSIADFQHHRFRAMVALLVQAPISASKHLTQEFYERNYNLRQRMDILEVLSAGAQELSSPEVPATCNSQESAQSKIVSLEQASAPTDWHDIVRQRIESKTRRFVKGPSKPEAAKVVNRFSGVAGHFFYPLLKNYDRKENTFDMMGEDSLVLSRLVYTLGVIMYAAVNTPEASKIGTTFMEYLWAIRYHSDPIVCHAILFAVSMVILAVPHHYLLNDLQSYVMEMKYWLEDIMEKSNDTQAKKLSLQCLVLLENIIKKEIYQQVG